MQVNVRSWLVHPQIRTADVFKMFPSSERQTEYVYVKLRTSGFLSGVGEVYFNVSEERASSFFRVAEFSSTWVLK